MQRILLRHSWEWAGTTFPARVYAVPEDMPFRIACRALDAHAAVLLDPTDEAWDEWKKHAPENKAILAAPENKTVH